MDFLLPSDCFHEKPARSAASVFAVISKRWRRRASHLRSPCGCSMSRRRAAVWSKLLRWLELIRRSLALSYSRCAWS